MAAGLSESNNVSVATLSRAMAAESDAVKEGERAREEKAAKSPGGKKGKGKARERRASPAES